ncbi:MAG: hypothetical protein PHQ20_02115 [Candidatus Moranbacteria bacterium]|nr:hypothetical protein [Candidatus Moranbacteria bacterium]
MFFKLQPIIYTVIFFLVLEISAFKQDWFFQIVLFLFIYSIITIWPLARKIRYLAFPLFLSLGSFSLLFFIDSFLEKQVFILVVSGVYYLALLGSYRLKFYSCDQTAQGMLNLVTIASMFFWFLAIYAWFLNYVFAFWLLPLVIFLSTAFISIPSFIVCSTDREKIQKKIKKKKEKKKFFGNQVLEIVYYENRRSIIFLDLILALFVAQFAWAVSYWPFNYLTLGTSLLIVFYIGWDTIRNFIQGKLSLKRSVVNGLMAMLFITAIISTSQWDLVV